MMKKLKWIFRILVLVVALSSAWYWLHGPDIPTGSYLVLDVSGAYSEARPNGLLSRLLDRDRSLSDLTEALRKVRHDGRIAGVMVRLNRLDAGWAQTQEIRSALSLVKAQGKRVIAEVEVELAPASKELYLASVADKVYIAPAAAPLFTGLSAHSVFLGGVWPKLNIEMQVEKIREYKSAGEQISEVSMSPAHREMLDSILDDVHAQLVRTLAGARNLTVEEVDAAIEAGHSLPQALVQAGLADAVKGAGEVLVELGEGKRARTVGAKTYADVSLSSLGVGDGPSIAVIHASGAIQMGKSRPGSGAMGSRTISEAIEQAAADGSVSAIVLRVASPGGSPAASDEIWLAARAAAKDKPVIASLGDVAASGGYYIASAADRIIAAPGTLTGSIGVVFFKPNIAGLLEHMGVHTASLQRGRYAGLLDLDKSFDPEELEMVRASMQSVYSLFLERVATGRKRKVEEIDLVGGGRVWTGQQAFDRGLVDEIGTFDDAVRAAANAAGIHDADKVTLVHYPKAGLLDGELDLAGAGVVAAMQPPALRAIADSLGGTVALLNLEPGVQAIAESIPTIE